MVQKDILSFGHAKVLSAVKDLEHCKRLANMCVAEGLSVRELEALKNKKPRQAKEEDEAPNYYEKQADVFKQKLEHNSGFHFDVKMKNNGAGSIAIKFTNEAEFNDIYEYLLK